MSEPTRFLILDACVLIDLSHIDRDVLAEVCRTVGSVHVARSVFDEVKQIDEAATAAVGLALAEPELEDLLKAARLPRESLSLQDRLCLLIAARQRWTCVSNDKPLRAACASRSVPVLWGLEMLALAAPEVAIARLEKAAWAIHAKNPRYVPKKLVEVFVAKLRRK
ncbi:MAG: hypothetical protein ABSC94_12395 [Polyangiaceae bacterium]